MPLDIIAAETPEALAAAYALAQAEAEAARAEAEKARLEADLKLLEEALGNFQLCEEAESEIRKKALAATKFSTGDQWDPAIKLLYKEQNKPCITTNRIARFVNHNVGQQRMARPGIDVDPVDGGADIETAEVFTGMVKHIERQSHAQVAYDHGFECMLRGGFGYWRVDSEYADGSLNQELFIRKIKNPFSIYFDPSANESDYSDAGYAFEFRDMRIRDYKREHPNSQLASMTGQAGTGHSVTGWMTKDTIRVARYWWVDKEQTEIVVLPDGKEVEPDKIPPELAQAAASLPRRPAIKRKVRWARINQVEVLDRGEWAGEWIPIIPVLGYDLDLDGERYLAGMVHDLMDPARAYNFWQSAATAMAARPKEPYRAAEGSLAGHERDWEAADTKAPKVLYYKPMVITTANGQQIVIPPPSRDSWEAPIMAMIQMLRLAEEDMKAGADIYDASLGSVGAESSGVAIRARQRQTEVGTVHFIDNQARALWHTGRILVDLIPKIYDAPRVQRIITPSGTTDIVGVYSSKNPTSADAKQKLAGKVKANRIYDLGVGRFDVAVSTRPSTETQRQQSVEALTALVQAWPALMGQIGDILVGQMDFPEAKQAQERLKKGLPPQLQDAPEEGDPEARYQQLQAQTQMVMQQHEALTKQLNAAMDVIENNEQDIQSKERIASLNAEVQLRTTEAKLSMQMTLDGMKAEMEKFKLRIQQLDQERAFSMQQAAQREAQEQAAANPQAQEPQPAPEQPAPTSNE